VGTALFATLCAATVAIISARTFEKLSIFRPRSESTKDREGQPGRLVALGEFENGMPGSGPDGNHHGLPSSQGAVKPSTDHLAFDDASLPQPPSLRPAWWGSIALVLLGVFFGMIFLRMVAPGFFRIQLTADVANQNLFARVVNALSILAIPFLLSFFPIYAVARGLKVYDEFVEGAKEAFNVILKVIPFLVTMLVAIGMFKGAGGIDLLTQALSPILTPLHFPTELVPLALMRPLSGSATLALLADIVHRFGPENIIALMAATIYGSTETTFYVATVYF